MEIPSKMAITSVDVAEHVTVGSVAGTRSELVGLALWLLAERAAMDTSVHSDFLQTLPVSTLFCGNARSLSANHHRYQTRNGVIHRLHVARLLPQISPLIAHSGIYLVTIAMECRRKAHVPPGNFYC